ncbi:MAG: hypothetical protein NTZ05_17865 [Chloroflexi bacterium]|nr:hypothetical protein [Chloroflexota bacterium]
MALRGVLARRYALRQTADYDLDRVTGTEAARAVQRTRNLVSAVQQRLQSRGGETT